MDKSFENIFTKDSVYFVCSIVGIVLLTFHGVAAAVGGASEPAMMMLAMDVCLVCLFLAFKQHDKKTMYGLIGMLLGFIVLSDLLWLVSEETLADSLSMIKYLLLVCLDIIFCVNHFFINSSSKASSERVALNQTLMLVLLAAIVIAGIMSMLRGGSLLGVLTAFSEMGGYFCAICCIACIESKIDAYRIIRGDRESSGEWNDESKKQLKEQFFGK